MMCLLLSLGKRLTAQLTKTLLTFLLISIWLRSWPSQISQPGSLPAPAPPACCVWSGQGSSGFCEASSLKQRAGRWPVCQWSDWDTLLGCQQPPSYRPWWRRAGLGLGVRRWERMEERMWWWTKTLHPGRDHPERYPLCPFADKHYPQVTLIKVFADKELPRWLCSKESACQAGDASSIPGSGRSPGGGHGNPL